MLATEYAKWYDIPAQAEGETDMAFRHRVAGELRDLGHIIEAHEAQQERRWDDPNGGDMVMAGIAGALAMVLQGKSYGSTGVNLVGDDIAAGVIAQSPKQDIDPMMLLIAALLR